MSQIPNLEARIEAAKGKDSKYGVTVADGTEVEKVRSNAMRGQDDGSVPSARTAEQIAADRAALAKKDGSVTTYTMPDTSEAAMPRVQVGDLLLLRWEDPSFFRGWNNAAVNPNTKIMLVLPDGARRDVTGPGAEILFDEIKRLAGASKVKARR